jgi:hypothetical protein
MPKTKISEFDVDPANNTDINSINIAEGCAPSGINNAIRQLMSDLKEFQTGAGGDPFNGAVNGTVGATTPSTGAFTTLSATGVATVSAGTVSAPAITTTGDTNTGIYFPAADTIGFAEGGVEALRINANGQTATSIAGTASLPSFTRNGDENTGIFFPAADTVAIACGGSETTKIIAGQISIPGTSSAASSIRLFEDTDNGTNYVDIIAPSAITSNITLTIPDATGTVMVSGNMPAFFARLGSNQSISFATATKLVLDTELFDTNSNFDTATYRFTPTVAGYYQISYALRGTGSTTNTNTAVILYKNGSAYTSNSAAGIVGTLVLFCGGSSLVYMNGSSDYVELYGLVNGTGTASFTSVNANGSFQTWMSGAMVRAA